MGGRAGGRAAWFPHTTDRPHKGHHDHSNPGGTVQTDLRQVGLSRATRHVRRRRLSVHLHIIARLRGNPHRTWDIKRLRVGSFTSPPTTMGMQVLYVFTVSSLTCQPACFPLRGCEAGPVHVALLHPMNARRTHHHHPRHACSTYMMHVMDRTWWHLLPLPARARQSARLHAHPRRRPCHPALPRRRRETSRLSFCCSSRLVHPYSSAGSLPTFFSLSRAIAESDERAAAAAAKCYPKAATCLWHTTLRDLRLRIALSTYVLRTRSGARSGSICVA